jgi:hypothetical protein
MASPLQIEANRRNAAGPHKMSETGQQAIRGNAIRHGLATRIHVVLPGEDQKFFDEILEALRAEYVPLTAHEEMLVHQIAENYWRLIRARNMESSALIFGLEDLSKRFGTTTAQPDDLRRGSNLALVLCKHEALLTNTSRYETAAERSYYRAIRELRVAQSNRRQEPGIGSVPQSAPPPVAEIRSVPQSEPAAPPPPKQVRSADQIMLAEIERASLTMSPKELDAFMWKITAPPGRTPSAAAAPLQRDVTGKKT